MHETLTSGLTSGELAVVLVGVLVLVLHFAATVRAVVHARRRNEARRNAAIWVQVQRLSGQVV